MITYEYQNSKENLIKTTYDYYIEKEIYKKQLKKIRTILIVIVAWAALNIIIRIMPFENTQKDIYIFGFVIIVFVVGVYFLYNLEKYYLMKLKSDIKKFHDKNKFLYEDKFIITMKEDKTICLVNSRSGDSCVFKLESLNNVININNTFILCFEKSNIILVPFTAFKNKSEKDEFERIVKVSK